MDSPAGAESGSETQRMPGRTARDKASTFLKITWPWFAAALSGVLLTLCFPRWDYGWLCWVALTPLITAVWFSDQGRWWKIPFLGYVTGLVFFWTVFSWLTTVTVLGWFILAFYLALYPAFWAWFVGFVVRKNTSFQHSGRNLLIAIACAAAWVSHEWMRGWLFSGFGWNDLGVALHKQLPLIQIVEWTGVPGLSFLVAMVNVIAVISIRRLVFEAGRIALRPRWDFSLTMTLVVVVFTYGVRALQQSTPTAPLRVAAVQANIPQDQKWNERFEDDIFRRYTNLTETALALEPELLIWPEAATPRALFGDRKNYEWVTGLAAKTDTNFLLGTIDFDDQGDYNAAVLLTNRGRDDRIYHKIHLVPFGEFVPFRKTFPLFAMIVGDLVPGDFRGGTEFTILETSAPRVRIGPLICFEDTVARLTRRFVLQGAQLLVNLTNDGWFKHSQAAEQHLANALLRAVENRRPLVRSANTGVTCIIDSFGRVTNNLRSEKGSHFIQGVMFGRVDVPVNGRITFFTRYGNVFAHVCLAATAGLLITRAVRRRFEKM